MAVEPTTGAETARLSEARERYVAAGVATSGLFVEHAHGATIVDVEGREYIDFVGGIGCLNGGHTPEAVVSAIREQAERYLHQCFSVGMYEPYIEVCRRICELHPGTFDDEGPAAELRRRGRRERGQDRALRDRPRRDRLLRPGLPRPHADDDDA